jgi:AraC-like DNA-binding protein
MKVQLENPLTQGDQSFGLMFNPRLNDLFYWHFHTEYELVYIEAKSGPRHVGSHTSRYSGSDLILIGSNIPHLNFDYGVKGSYRKVVVHLKKSLVETQWANMPELVSLNGLFEQASKGLYFIHPQKNETGQRLFALEGLSPARQYLELLKILIELAEVGEIHSLHERPYANEYTLREQNRIRHVFTYIDRNYSRSITLAEVAEVSHLSREAFCRYFKRMTNYSFTEFLNRYRVSQSKNMLMNGYSVTDACYACGFGSLSYYNRIFRKVTDENPSTFRKRYEL